MLKGLLLHTAAKVVFVVSTYIIHLYLGKTLSPAEYGVIGVVLNIITLNYNFLSNGARQAISKNLAMDKYDEVDLIKKGVCVQIVISIALMLLNWLFSKTMASSLHASNMTYYIKISALMIPFTAIYFTFVGIVNGLKMFVIESTIVTIYPLLRMSVIPYVQFFFSDSALGTVAGFFTAAFVCCLLGTILYLLKINKKLIKRSYRIQICVFLKNMVSYLGFFTGVTLLLSIDMLFVNAYVINRNEVGYYTAAVNFAKVPYYLLTAFYIVVLPVITTYYIHKEIKKAQKKINVFINAILLTILPIVSIVGASSGNLLASFYSTEYRNADSAALILLIAQFLIGLFVVINMCITATQEKIFSVILVFVTVIIDCILCYFFVNEWGITGTAISSLISSAIGSIIFLYKIQKIYGKIYDWTSLKLLLFNGLYFVLIFNISRVWLIENLLIIISFYAVTYLFFICTMQVLRIVNIKEMLLDIAK